jgi:hypothetical protein
VIARIVLAEHFADAVLIASGRRRSGIQHRRSLRRSKAQELG